MITDPAGSPLPKAYEQLERHGLSSAEVHALRALPLGEAKEPAIAAAAQRIVDKAALRYELLVEHFTPTPEPPDGRFAGVPVGLGFSPDKQIAILSLRTATKPEHQLQLVFLVPTDTGWKIDLTPVPSDE